jgi:phage major head subunit gpT-like protein
MIINSSNLDALFIAFSKQFNDAYMQEPAPLLDAIGSRIPSNTRDQRYPIVQAISGAMRKWNGERFLNNVAVNGFTVENKLYENSLAIQRVDLEDDQYSVYSSMLIPNLARHAKLLADQEIAAAIAANATGYDGKAFFATDHPYDPSGATAGSQSNLKTGYPLNSTNLAYIQALMMNFRGPDGLPMGCYGDTLLVPPSLKYVADVLANSTFYPEGKNGSAGTFSAQSNVFQGQLKVVASPWLTDSGDPATAVWYLLDTRTANMRPFFWQDREAAQLTALVDPSNPIVFMEDKYVMGVRARGAAAAALWFKAFKVSGV